MGTLTHQLLAPEQYGEYESFAKNHRYGSFMQSVNWTKVKDNWGHEVLVVRNENNEIVGGVLILIKRMPLGMCMLYAPRGPVCDYLDKDVMAALLEGIKSRHVGAACLDVYEEEGDLFFEDKSGHILDDDTLARLISMPNVIVTSHQAFLTEEALENIAETTVRNILDLRDNGQCPNEVCHRGGEAQDCKNGKCF